MNIKPKSLYMQDNNGAVREWRIGVIGTTIVIEHGVLDGRMQTVTEKVDAGKAGRSIEDQIMLQMASKISRQRDKGYRSDINEANQKATNKLGFKKPMLAQALKNVKNIIFAGAYVQPKYDGNRCIITKQNDKMVAYSRNGKIIAANLDHIFIGLDLDEGDYVDGELYHHGSSLQTIVSWIKRNQEDTKKLNFHAYDLMSNVPYIDRYEELSRKVNGGAVILAPTDRIERVEEVWEIHKGYTSDGYEGAIIRWSDAGYEDGKRSKSLVKVKTFLDGEFLVKDIHASKDGWAILECWLEGQRTFRVSAPGTMPEKEYVWYNRDLYIGELIRVEYMNMTKDGIPFHPIATNWISEI